MPTESRERIKESLYTNYGGNGGPKNATDSFTSLRAQYAPKPGAADHPGSNGTHRSRSRTTLTEAMSAVNSLSRESSNRPAGDRRVRDVISLQEELRKQGNWGPTVMDNGNGRRPRSRSRVPAGLPAGSKGSASRWKEPFENPVPNSQPPVSEISEITELPPTPRKDDHALKYEGQLSTTQVQKVMERSAPSQDFRRRPSTKDRPVETNNREDFRAVKQNGLRRSISLDKRSAKSSSAAASHRHGQTFSHARPSSSSGSRRSERPESGSSNTASHQADRRRSLRGSNGSIPNLKQEAPKRRSTSSRAGRSKPSSTNGFDLEFNVGSENERAKSSSPDIWQNEEPAHSAMQSHAWHEGANGFKNEIDTADVGRLYTRQRSNLRKSRQEDSSDLTTGSRRRSLGKMSNSKEQNGSDFPVTRLESNANLTQEDPTDSTHRRGRQGGNNGGTLKQDNASNSGAGGTREDSITGKALDVVKYSSSSFQRDHHVRRLLKGVAAASYNGGWLPYDEMVPFPDDVAKLNKFLNDCRNEVEAGVPGRVLTVVLGHENSDLDSIVSTIAYAYFLSSIGGQEGELFVPVMNMRQEDLVLRTEAVWLFKVSGLDTSKLLFVDQISLQYYHRFGNLKLVLVDHSKLAPHQETLQEAVIEIVDHNLPEDLYSWVSTTDIQQVGSCCTIIAERFAAEAPEHLAGRGLNRLLLGPILLDTANLDPRSARCTSRDVCMAAFLIHGAGRFGQQGFFKLLRRMKFDISTLSTLEMLRKDFKQWTLGPGKTDTYGLKGRVLSAAMSTLSGVSLKEFMIRKNILQELTFFGRKFKLDLHLIVSGYFDPVQPDRYKKEILIVPENIELKEHLRTCFRPHKEDLQLSYIRIPGLPDEMLVYKQGLVTASRSIIRQILVDYFVM